MTPPPFTLHLGDCLDVLRQFPDNSIDAVVTDPPYGLGREPDALAMLRDWIETGHHEVKGAGFMGKAWDAFVPQPVLWAEVFRVLKPGGHVVAFAGTRTQDLMALGLRLAGFEIRDLLAWVYGSGFPKSHDVSKGIDKLDAVEARRQRALQFTGWLRSTGITSAQIDDLTGSFMGGHYLTASSQPQVATREHFEAIRPALGVEVPAWVEAMIDQRTIESETFKGRAVVARVEMRDTTEIAMAITAAAGEYDQAARRVVDITAPATPEAAAWQGWGTALKPALEPITLARKPLRQSVAANVLQWRTGAINVDGCRIHSDDAQGGEYTVKRFKPGATLQAEGGTWKGDGADYVGNLKPGRWPANLLHDGSDEVVAGFPETTSGKPSGTRNATETGGGFSQGWGDIPVTGFGDSGSAARFFYCAKASKSDRDEGLQHLEARRKAAAEFRPNHAEKADAGEGGNPYGRWDVARNIHPTVKPTDLMRWLCRLITPPGGVILDPFMGSGSTGKAAQREGFAFVGVEMDPAYMEIARARIESALNPEPVDPEPAADNDNAPADLFAWGNVAT